MRGEGGGVRGEEGSVSEGMVGMKVAEKGVGRSVREGGIWKSG